jgi:hypothetical protein
MTIGAITMDGMEKVQAARPTIYIRLLEEAVTCIRPTEAEALEDSTYRVLPTPNYDPTDEVWEFVPGSKVHCELFDDANGAYLLAIAESGVDPKKKGRSNIAVLQDAIEHRDATGHLLWHINLEDIKLVAEYTTTEGPWGDDWFLVSALAHKTPHFFTLPLSTNGIETLLKLVRTQFATNLRLTDCTEWKSVVLWPKAIEGTQLIEFGEHEPRNWRERLRTWYDGFIKEPHVSHAVSNLLLQPVKPR